MPFPHFPVRPNLDQLQRQAMDLLHALHAGDAAAIVEFSNHHPEAIDPASAKLPDVQLAVARGYQLPNWPRLVTACHMTEAIWQGEIETVREIVTREPALLHEDARGVKGNWGPPMSYAANIGQSEIVRMLHELGANDLEHAFGRACLQGKLETARELYDMGARPAPGFVMGPCETLSGSGLKFLLDLGVEPADADGDRLAPAALVLETYCRNPAGKHQCLELLAAHGLELPDTPPMAIHRGRIDLLQAHLRHNPQMLHRTYSHQDIWPPSLGCHADQSLALHGTPIDGTTLLHIAIEYDEMDIIRWLIEHGTDVNARGATDADGFGNHTPLFGCIVSQPHRVGRQKDAAAARLLLNHGACPDIRASLRKRLRFVEDETLHEYRNVTPLMWGEQFHDQNWVSTTAMRLIAERAQQAAS